MCAHAGTYADVTGLPVCYPCPNGQFASATGSTTCTACDPGNYQLWPITAFQSWPLASAYVASAVGGTTMISAGGVTGTDPYMASCQKCPAGMYQAAAGQSGCIACTAGTRSAADAATTCDACPLGQTNMGNSTTCTGCNAGYYADATVRICMNRDAASGRWCSFRR